MIVPLGSWFKAAILFAPMARPLFTIALPSVSNTVSVTVRPFRSGESLGRVLYTRR